MWAGAYQMSEPERLRICGPGTPSMNSAGCEGALAAKKKSGPRAIHAVPSLRSLGSKVELMASRSAGLLEFASSMSCGAVDLSAANAHVLSTRNRIVSGAEDLRERMARLLRKVANSGIKSRSIDRCCWVIFSIVFVVTAVVGAGACGEVDVVADDAGVPAG